MEGHRSCRQGWHFDLVRISVSGYGAHHASRGNLPRNGCEEIWPCFDTPVACTGNPPDWAETCRCLICRKNHGQVLHLNDPEVVLMGVGTALRTRLDNSFCCPSGISSQAPVAGRAPQASFKCDMGDSGMLVAEDPEGCRDEFAPPQTCIRALVDGALALEK